MAQRKAKFKADKKLIIDAFAEMAKEKNIDRDLLQGIVEETLSLLVKKKYSNESNFEIIVNMDKGDIEIYLMRTIVENVENSSLEIALEEANERGEEKYEIGDEFIEEITLDNINTSFGRRLISLASQNLNQKIREVEKDNIYNEYNTKVGEIIIGELYQIRRNSILVLHNKVETILPREEQIPNEPYRFKKNQTIKAIVKEVRRSGISGLPEIILSRASDDFLARLFEIEIPEIYDGIIQIKSIARDPGERSKVAVVSFDDRVDPVGACVGMKGIRIHSIVRELNNENIDLIEYSENDAEFIAKALLPAKVKDVNVQPEIRSATVVVPDDQVSLAIGKNGQNVRLASKLTGYSITLINETGEDIDLSEFEEEIGTELYKNLMENGIETARGLLETEPEELLKIKGMTKKVLLEIRSILLGEFDEPETDEMIEKIKNLKAKSSRQKKVKVKVVAAEDKENPDATEES
ncbi:MAG: transcription termination factor NusA [Ignavibacteria bacterium GWB2_35_12]|nr:MAG: transcription termination factor NusA [Ignavibacteria bacterium GWA2_35_8]OGU42257.1 MAG: transcription termination factor NusA [Ignavibacteria bacterium GWB2_35_12]OGU93522.1 MAG: transcription termination factor NusA [Ignavibacteria bacterium RIFOXYA2_FULL_35_10]OGV22168.1 MAG: transcription termination factor NusA [Ignavibacteria bacterium RIFOXYC2_FULL_35_21]